MDRFSVMTTAFSDAVVGADLVKIDVEGHELEILSRTSKACWERKDALVEVGSVENAEGIFDHFNRLGVNLFAQKIGWRRVKCISEMPTSHRDGTLYVSTRPEMNWS